jgi:hypothetical protein
MHDVGMLPHPRQKSGDAAAQARFAPLQLHCLIPCMGTNAYWIFAPSDENWGWESDYKTGRRVRFLFLGFVFGSAGRPFEKKQSEMARPKIGLWQKLRVNPN